MRILISLLIATLLFSCEATKKEATPIVKKTISSVKITPIFNDSISIRAIAVTPTNDLIYGGNKTTIGHYNATANTHTNLLSEKVSDTLNVSFRAVAHVNNTTFGVSIVNPALLFKITQNGEVKLVYKEAHEKVFYDAIAFWNEQEGIAMGDPTADCISIIITRDGGNTWQKVSCDQLPKAKEGEAAFAASNTNISIVDDNVWIATGGKASRILHSADKGKTWNVFETPIVQGIETTGMYSLDFYDAKNGFAIGGDYTKPDSNEANKIRTSDGGKTWQIVAKNTNPAYRSCVQYVPNSDAKALVAVGFKGIDYSNDAGNTWKHLSDEGFYTIKFINDSTAYAAGKNRIAKLNFLRN
ncbi:YCF48-related protein [Kordia algicida OT-1]|uniref:Putative oxidoreductase (Putative secreted protein) n=1 Tax=Kordia algicida OT-1 TaxID=391587 RepID=A9E7K7_9FLAO|nr:YCF48-related protein [Kordia algicida]EDP94908.1 putative oxidoreductase (putative secreted protein) [Kordia algicida OT-1]